MIPLITIETHLVHASNKTCGLDCVGESELL